MSTSDVHSHDAIQERNRRLAQRVGLVILGMALFGWALVPIYRWVCVEFGVGTVQQKPNSTNLPAVVGDREVEVRFVGLVDVLAPAKIEPLKPSLVVKVGEQHEVMYRFTNLSDKDLDFQAVHSVAPSLADPMFHKVECFCFTTQTLKPREVKDLPVAFWVDPKFPTQYHTVTLQYTLYNLNPDPTLLKKRQEESAKKSGV
ncbi:Cytochrome c oxidase assembly protein CtaG [compost metagenome]